MLSTYYPNIQQINSRLKGVSSPKVAEQLFVAYEEMILDFARISKQFFHGWRRLKNSKEKHLQIDSEQISKKKEH